MIKALQKGLLKSWHANMKLPWPSGHENQKPPPHPSMSVVPRHCGDDAEVKTWHLTPAMSPVPMVPGLQTTKHINAHHF